MQVGIVLPLGKAVTLAKALETAILDLHSATTAIPAVQSTNGTIPNKMTVIREDCVVYLVASREAGDRVIMLTVDLAMKVGMKVGLAVAVADIWLVADTQVSNSSPKWCM